MGYLLEVEKLPEAALLIAGLQFAGNLAGKFRIAREGGVVRHDSFGLVEVACSPSPFEARPFGLAPQDEEKAGALFENRSDDLMPGLAGIAF